jgi:DNA-binding MarR family transcriptional regulator
MATASARGAASRRRTVDALAQLSFVVQATLARRAATLDLSLIQTRLLAILRDREPTMQQLAALLELDKSSVTGLVDRAARRGLVRRVPSEHDRRAAHVTLTDAGRELVAAVGASFDADVAGIVSSLRPADRETLTTLVTTVLNSHAARNGIDLAASSP